VIFDKEKKKKLEGKRKRRRKKGSDANCNLANKQERNTEEQILIIKHLI